MTQERIHLADGQSLQKRRGVWILQPDGVTVDVQLAGGVATMTDPKTGRRRDAKVVSANDDASGPQKPPAAPREANGSQGRWQTYNEFVDAVGPLLTLAEREVWHIMFRHTRGGVVETTARRLATAAAIDKDTVSLAQRRLEAAGLIRTIWKSTDRSRASKYALNPSPAACLPKLLAKRSPK